MSEKQNIKTCKRCSSAFECRADNIALCACSAVKMSTASQQFLAETYNDCLCINCLNALNTRVTEHLKHNLTPPTLDTLFIYSNQKNSFLAFTKLYHYLNDLCCGNGGRHFACGHPKNKSISLRLQLTIQ